MSSVNSFNEDEIKAFEPAEKIGLVACVNPDGLPHVSLITSIQGTVARAASFTSGVTNLARERIS